MWLGLINLFLQTGWTNINTEHHLFYWNEANNSSAEVRFQELCRIRMAFLNDAWSFLFSHSHHMSFGDHSEGLRVNTAHSINIVKVNAAVSNMSGGAFRGFKAQLNQPQGALRS